jgi:hypothetical protein
MIERKCCNCEAWQRDGHDGICRANSPQPEIVQEGKSLVVVWPKTNDNDWCMDFIKLQ